MTNSGAIHRHLVLDVQTWVHRRVERIRFIDDTAISRKVSIDYDLRSSPLWPVIKEQSRQDVDFMLPAAILRKWPLTSFSLTDSGGQSRRVLQRREYSEHASAMIGDALRGRAPNAARPRLDEETKLLVGENWRESHHALARMRSEIQGHENPEGSRLLSDVVFRFLSEELTRNFILFTPVRLPTEAAGVLKLEYVAPLIWESVNVPKRLGWHPHLFSFQIASAGQAASYHVEVEAPEGLELKRAALLRQGQADAVTEVWGRKSRIHLNTTDQPRFVNYSLDVQLQPQRRGILRSALAGSAFTFGAVLVLLLLRNRLLGDSVDTSAVAAIVFSVPAIVLILVNRTSEHGLAERLLIGVRSVTAVSFLSALVATAIIVFGYRGLPATASLVVCFFVTTSALGALIGTYKLSRTKVKTRRLIDGEEVVPPERHPRA